MRRAEEERTTSTSGDSGLSGPQSRLGLVRAKPSPSSELKLKKKKKNVYSYVEAGLQPGLSVSLRMPVCLVHCCIWMMRVGFNLHHSPQFASHHTVV